MPPVIAVIADQTNRYGRDALAGIDEVARAERWCVLLVDDATPEPDVHPAGMIGHFIKPPSWMERLRHRGVPTVTLGQDVQVDQVEAGRCAARHFRACGLAHGAAVSRAGSNPMFGERLAGFAEVLGGSPPFILPPFAAPDRCLRNEIQALGPWLQSLPHPIGIFAANDHLAKIVSQACAAFALAVPRTIAIVGADDDLELCLSAGWPLSSVRMPHQAQAFIGAQRLRRLLAGEPAGTVETVRPGSVCARLSSDVLHCADPAVAGALAWIRGHFAAPLGIDALATSVGLNRRTLERRFRQALGYSMHDELRRVRIAHAKELLLHDQDLPIVAVAAAVGMSRSAFMTAFSLEIGDNPGSWRGRQTV
jgi:LacI family transcriptional regulator